MKVQTKITLLLALVIATFLVGLWSFNAYDQLQFRRIADERWRERNESLDTFLAQWGDPLRIFALDYSNLDDMVTAVAENDQRWLEGNLSEPTLDSFHANAVWIYGLDGTLVWQKNNLSSPDLQFPVPREQFAQLFAKESFCHFFIKVGGDIIEVRGGTVHPSRDFARQTRSGYLFVGRLWSKPMLREMSMFTGNEVTLVSPPTRSGENINDEENGLVAFSRPLFSWDGKPLAQLVVRNESPVVRELKRSSRWLLYSLVCSRSSCWFC
jgi:hypothetical protein